MNIYFICLMFYAASTLCSDNQPWLPKKAMQYFAATYDQEQKRPDTHANYAKAIDRLYSADVSRDNAWRILLACSPSKSTGVNVFWTNFQKHLKSIYQARKEERKWLPLEAKTFDSGSDDEAEQKPVSRVYVATQEQLDFEVAFYTKFYQPGKK